MTDDVTSICQKCGASVYRQHLDSGIARYEGGNLLCAHCVSEYERSHDSVMGGESQAFEAISLDEADDMPVDLSQSRIMTSTHTMGVAGAWDDSGLTRQVGGSAQGATRCRTFHSKLNANALQFMNRQINEWVDKNENMAIKFATSTIGTFEGKHAEPNLLLTIFY